ncbi:hypothetical protein LN650_03035 [Klebsiella pneumoniae subsp. pneumoniae]|nr:hypothetical protein [Klebsiella pneumoniae subsp. pneumoniae]
MLTIINERLPLHGLQLRPYASVGIAMFHAGLSAEQFYRRAVSAAVTARRKGQKPDRVLRSRADGKGSAPPDGKSTTL